MDIDMPLCVAVGRVTDAQNRHSPAGAFEKTLLLQSYTLAALGEDDAVERAQLLDFDKMLLRQLNTELGSNQLLRAEYLCSLLHTTAALKKAGIVRAEGKREA